MDQIKAYTATIEVTFETYGDENPRTIAKYLADSHNGMRGANLHMCGVMKRLIEETDIP
ncbi:MAG: hypothetical protein Q8P17_01620 [bacterium]|nr:hypothetical protein [bacterium]